MQIAIYYLLINIIVQGSTLTVARLPGASENGTQLASENDSVICSISEEQND